MKELTNEERGGFNVGYYSTDSVQATNVSWTRQSRFNGPSKPSVKTVFEAPIAVKQNHFVITNKRDLLFGGDGEFYNINIRGEINWHYKDSRNFMDRFFFTSPIILKNGYVLVGTSGGWDSKGHKVMAFDRDGHLVWDFKCDDAVSSTCVTDSEGNIYFTTYGSKLYSVDLDGNLRWIFRYEAEFSITPVISDEWKIYISSNDEFMMILDRFGDLLKKFKIGTCGPYSFPVFDQRGNLYFKTNMIDDIQLISLNNEGTINWLFSPERGDIITSPALNDAGFLFVGATFFNLFVLTAQAKRFGRQRLKDL
ncbi:PQQ-binding-like beta-propeller repeat protein [Paenibacillus sonchi]|uniref:PQQ-binding-like beta-propeller repeat protein n=2 Tax=Paenibacillus sonchi TaxID=373687 RepID=A0A974PCD4_9BACL|nr:PQQ-binding-like beta-propeller repeat protein [Paenibacillus sonchi]QQZ60788.1 PQQ-binding-like beta-propeller repeat protein [Paenibacillus sonchi]